MDMVARTPSILVVEDESLIRMMAVDMFEAAGFHVVECDSGEGAVALIEANGFAGLFTDVDLAGPLSGIALAHIFHDRHPKTAIIIVSGQVKGDAERLPAHARFLAKPYDTTVVVDTLNQLMAR